MAYHNTSGTAANTADFLIKLKDFLVTTCGWTLHDDQMGQAQPYFVTKSNGESGNEDIYVQFWNDSNADIIAVRGCLYWNATTHTAVKDAFYPAGTCITTKDSAAFLYWLYGDMDHVFIVTKIVANYYGHYSGIIKRFWSDKIAITQGGANAGSNVVVQVDDASFVTINKRYIIKDNANIERVLVTAKDTSATPNTVTIAVLASPYTVGAKMGEDPQPVIVSKNNMPGTFYAVNRWDGWASTTGQTGTCGPANGSFAGYCDPDLRYGVVVMFPWLAAMTASNNDELRGELIEIYSVGPGAGDSEDVIDLGTSTYRMFNTPSSGWIAVKE